jgi:hypothetical protein
MVSPLLIGPIFEFGKAILDRFVEDPAKKRDAEMEMFRMAAEGELKQVLAQLEINAREAQHASIFVAGWRPFFGWAGATGFLYSTVVQPILFWYGKTRGWPDPPDINMDLLWVVITGMLGIGGLRTFEKSKGVAK